MGSVQVGSHEQCLSACLKESEFVCRSVNYNYDTYICELNTEDRRSKPTHLRRIEENIDYFDNNCLTREKPFTRAQFEPRAASRLEKFNRRK